MLKIKDNVDLKELEKFGFEKITCFMEDDKNEYKYLGFLLDDFIKVNSDNALIKKEIETALSAKTLDKLYDLIKADLVEKVDQ